MTKNLLAIILIITGFQTIVRAQENDEIFTIYLVRHAEKDLTTDNQSDPSLTPCGVQRSESLSSFLKEVKIDVVYSTDYSRTQNTALPTATAKGLEITEYNPQALEVFSKLLMNANQNALVVGHSNTTGVLAGLLVGQEIEEFDESIYNRIYQVVIHKNSSRLHLFHTAFQCQN